MTEISMNNKLIGEFKVEHTACQQVNRGEMFREAKVQKVKEATGQTVAFYHSSHVLDSTVEKWILLIFMPNKGFSFFFSFSNICFTSVDCVSHAGCNPDPHTSTLSNVVES